MNGRRLVTFAWVRWGTFVLGLFGALLPGRGEVVTNIAMKDGALSAVRLTALPNMLYAGGYMPVRVRVENRAADTRAWRIEFINGHPVAIQGSFRSTFAFTVPATTTQETTVFVPVAIFPNGPAGGHIRGVIEGPEVATESFSFPIGATLRGPGRGGRIVSTPAIDAEVRKLAVAERDELARQAGARPVAGRRLGPRGPVTGVLDGATLVDPAQWPADWRTWSQFHTVLMSSAAWEATDPARRRALREWIAFGGQLILFPPQEGARRETSEGFGTIITQAQPIDRVDPMELGRQVNSGLGRVAMAGAQAGLVAKGDPMLDLRIGGRWLVGFLILFGVLIGPVNLFYFAPVGRRHRLFLTVPVISLVGSLVLAGVVVTSDGWGGRGYRQTLVILLPGENEAAILQRQVARTGMLLRQSFALPADTQLDHRLEGGPGGRGTELERHGDRAAGDWFSSRSIQYHELRRLTPTRARVDLVAGGRAGDPPVLQSSVVANLRSVTYRDEAGQFWTAAALPPGRRVTLERAPDGQGVNGLTGFSIARGNFYAEGDQSELAPLPTLGSIRWTEKFIHYTGRVEAATP